MMRNIKIELKWAIIVSVGLFWMVLEKLFGLHGNTVDNVFSA
ncbi:MAG: hypothetical protein WA749_14910 [Gelidibacter sp.]